MIVEVESWHGTVLNVSKEPGSSKIDTHARISGKPNSLCERSFKKERNEKRITPEMQQWLDGMETIDLPDSLVKIYDRAFENCKNLKKVTIPGSVDLLHEYAFSGCESLRQVIIQSGLTELQKGCFKDCSSLDEIIIPESVVNIGQGVFENCQNLRRITLPLNIENLDRNVLSGNCPFNNITFERNLDCIQDDNLWVSSDGHELLKYYYRDADEYVIPENITRIANFAFYNSTQNSLPHKGLKKLVIPHQIKEISSRAFTGSEIETIQVEKEYFQAGIKIYLPKECTLEVIKIDGSVIGKFMHARTKDETHFSPQDYDFLGLNSQYLKEKELLSHKTEIALNRLDFPYELSEEIKSKYASYLRRKWLPELLKGNDSESIIKYAEHLITVKNLDDVLERASKAGMTVLVAFLLDYKQIKFKINLSEPFIQELKLDKPNDLNSLRDLRKEWILYKFGSELKLRGYKGDRVSILTLPTKAGKIPITSVGYKSKFCYKSRFQYCVPKIIIPEGYTKVDDYAFNFAWIDSISLPDSLIEIGYKAFFHCSVQEIQLGKKLTKIGAEAFSYSHLRRIKIPDNVKTLGEKAFFACKDLLEVELGNGLETIGEKAFAICPKLVIHAPKGSSVIGYLRENKILYDELTHEKNQNFIEKNNLVLSEDGHELIRYIKNNTNEFTIPQYILKIANYAFYDLFNSQRGFGASMYKVNYGLKKLVIPAHVEEISRLSFSGLGSETVQVASKFYKQGKNVCLGRMRCLEVINDNGTVVGRFPGFAYFSEYDNRYTRSTSGQYYDDFPAPGDYDDLFTGIPTRRINVDLKIENAKARLLYPYELSEEFKQKYAEFLRKWWIPRLINNNEKIRDDELRLIISHARTLITKNADALLNKASTDELTELVAFLLDYKQSKLKRRKDKHESLTLEPDKHRKTLDLNSVREIEKMWKCENYKGSELTLVGYRGEEEKVLTFPTRKSKKPITKVSSWFRLFHPVEEIIIPEGYKSLGLFYYDSFISQLKRITLPDSLTSLGSSTFSEGGNLEEITLGNKLDIIESNTFYRCRALRRINIPDSIREIRYEAFRGCYNLEEIQLGKGLETIGERAFADCHKLNAIMLPASLKNIAMNAFENSGITIIELDQNNKNYKVKNGALYSADLKNLIIAPQKSE